MVVHETFGDFTLDSATRELLRAGQPVRLRAKAFDLLCILVARRPHVVSREELKQQIWNETHVTEASLDELVKVLRRALADDARQPRYIKTYKGGRGFSFCAPAAPDESTAAEFRLVWQGRDYPLAEGGNLVGRGRHCQAVIPDSTVSREHARISCDSVTREATIEHLSTVNPTVVNGVEVSEPRPLYSGDVIGLGRVQLDFQFAGDLTKTVRQPDGIGPRPKA